MSYVLATTEEKVRWYKYDLKPLKANEIGEYELLEVLDLRQVVKWADKASAKSAAQALGLKTWRYVKI
ncbi:hypothetical protein AABF64_002083 [Acinetobacter baumannii]|jgi:hypothetical protein|uniref:hypothetical protein n=1 Tax=Acinetobacter TaxID=469 RepID=UPI0002D0A074|nr:MULTISPECIES: hypothetical protein [Acinetobacter]ALY01432.1 hypothetical protein KBNAB1_3927 [Acinetobacter baumannii]EKT9248030.1 hypothetical protein [Acinetobacter baumannii]EKV8039625.1 hypothetical protein [Acinetobacter baumannii]EKW1488001.1 hypothetical protein [Acinetobacter baumannii]ENV65163.1 hypothetical protein F949_00062 [Acinetobacter junii NIPH 182]